MTMVSARDLFTRAPANLMQAVENVPGVSQVSEGQSAVPAVRGLARGRTLILVDGSRVSSERRVGPSASFMDPTVAEGVDVARGPGSVAYGSDAFGGVISVRTKRPGFIGTRVEGSATVGTGIPDRRADASFSQGFGVGGILVAVHTRDVEDYDSPLGEVMNSGYTDHGALVRAERAWGTGVLSASWQGDFARDVERPRNNSNVVRFYNPFDDSHRFNVSFERPTTAGFSLLKISAFLGTNTQRTDQDRIPTATRPRDITRADIDARDFQVRLSADRAVGDAQLELGADVNGRFGLEAHDIFIQYDAAGNVVSTTDNLSIESARRADTGLFVQGSIPLGKSFSAAGGLRGDYVANVNEGGYFGDRTVSNGAMAGFATLTAGPFSNMTFTAQIARGFRDPSLSDRFYRGPTGRGYITGNPDLEPETSLQVDLGARYATGRVRLATYFYHYRIDDLVERYEGEPDYFYYRNRGRAQIRGVEVEAQIDLGRGYALEMAGQIARGIALDDDAALDDIAPDMASLVLRKSFGQKFSAFGRAAFFADDHRAGPSEVAAPGHTNLDAGATWTMTRHLELRGAATNLLDDDYYASPDPRWVYAPGRTVSATLRVRF
jgi:outer membrane receptor protein involved in Fe transport